VGIVEKQGVKGSLYSYLGTLVGFVTAALLLPNIFTKAENGVLDLLVSWSLVFATLATLGLNNVTNRLFPYFRDQKSRHHGFSGILFWVTLAGFLLSLILYFVLRPWIIHDSEEQSALFIRYVDYIIPLTAFTAIYMVADIYYAMLMNAVRGIFLKEFLQRIFILIVILAFVAGLFKFDGFILFYVVALSLPGIIIAVALLRDGAFTFRPDMDHIRGPLGRQMASVAAYGVIIAFSNILIQYIDRIMINSYLDLEATGIYGRAFFFGTLVSIPIRAVSKISAVVVAEQWKDDDHESINRLYRDTSLHQLLFGLLIFTGIWGNIVNVFHILPDDYGEGKLVVFWIGLSNLFIMASGISGAIMTTSRYYRLLALFVMVFGALVIISNIIFIPLYGITGAALASAIAAFIYGLMRFGFLWIRYKMQPYTWKHLVALIIAGVSYLPAILIPDLNHDEAGIFWLCLDIILRSTSMAVAFAGLTLILKVSPDLNLRAARLMRQIKIRLTLHKPE